MTANKKRKDAHLWARDPDDWYVEPRWCSQGLFAVELFQGNIWDPACGSGRILDAARCAGHDTYGMDIRDRLRRPDHVFVQGDFLAAEELAPHNIVTNPPYLHADAFAAACLRRARRKVALLLRAQWANAGTRSRWLESLPLRRVLVITPRPSMPPGAVILANGGKDPSGGLQDYAWYIFERDYTGNPEFGWCRRPDKSNASRLMAEAA